MIRKIDHLAIAVESLEGAGAVYARLLGVPLQGQETVEEQGVRVGFFAVGQSHIELLEPLGPETPVGKFLQRRGPGLHHICLEVEGLADLLERLKQQGVRLIDERPRQGAANRLIAFVHPSSAGGVLIELSEKL